MNIVSSAWILSDQLKLSVHSCLCSEIQILEYLPLHIFSTSSKPKSSKNFICPITSAFCLTLMDTSTYLFRDMLALNYILPRTSYAILFLSIIMCLLLFLLYSSQCITQRFVYNMYIKQ